MNPALLYHLRDHLNAATGPDGRWPLAGGIEWHIIDPRLGNLRERIRWSRGGVGVIWRESSRSIRRSNAGVEGLAKLHLTAYFPSMEQFAYEGEYMLLEEALYYTLHDLPPAYGLQYAYLTDVQDMTLQMGDDQYGEVLVVAAQAEVRYEFAPSDLDSRTIRGVIVELEQGEINEVP